MKIQIRNNRNKILIQNGPRRHGQFKWHNENCDMEDYGLGVYQGKAYHTLWCVTHGQWASETPVKITWTFENGETLERSLS